jgi:hypothetical protein
MSDKTSMEFKDIFPYARPINLKQPKADYETSDMVSSTMLLKYLNEEVERHKESEGMQTKSWDRGFHNGSMTEAIILRGIVRKMVFGAKKGD